MTNERDYKRVKKKDKSENSGVETPKNIQSLYLFQSSLTSLSLFLVAIGIQLSIKPLATPFLVYIRLTSREKQSLILLANVDTKY